MMFDDDDLPEKIKESLSFLKSMMSGKEKKYEPYGPLSKEELNEWKAIHKEKARVLAQMENIEARIKLFWSNSELSRDLCEKNLQINNEILMVEKEVENKFPEQEELDD